MQNEKDLINYKKEVLDVVGRGFCAAKWFNATIWLNLGKTSSCHHPSGHKICENEIKNNPSALHNTLVKKVIRKQMLEGKRPKECEYCWKMEDIHENVVSDRVFKSIIYDQSKIEQIKNMPWRENVNLETLELSFGRSCNLACSYCGPTYSTRWGNDIKSNGPYLGLTGDCSGEFSNDGDSYDLYPDKSMNPYIKAFWDWWPNLSLGLKELRITGGEPLISEETWFLIDKFVQNQNDIKLALNSNLCLSEEIIEKLISKSKKIKKLAIYTSCEATGAQAEYIRDGLTYNRFIANCLNILSNANLESFNFMLTINSLCLYSITDFLDTILNLKSQFNSVNISFTLNVLRFPSFMSPLVLPVELLKNRCSDIIIWKDKNLENPLLSTWEIASLDRLIDYLGNVSISHSEASSRNIQIKDFKLFYTQFDKRRGKDFKATFPKELGEWYESIVVS